MGSTDYEFTTLRPEMIGQIAALRAQEWAEDPGIGAAYIDWMYRQNPCTDQVRFYVALSSGRVAGMRGMSTALLSDGRRNYPIVAATDTLVAPAERGRHLFTRLTRYALDDVAQQGCDYVVNLAGGRTTQLLSLRSGWKRVCIYQPLRWGSTPDASNASTEPSPRTRGRSRLRTYIRQSRLNPWIQAGKARFRRFRQRLKPHRARFERFDAWAEGATVSGAVRVEKAPRPRQMAALSSRRPNDGDRLALVTSEAYYEWRFRDPRCSFRFLFAESNADELAAFLVLCEDRDGSVGIVDWQYTDEETLLAMVRTVQESGGVSSLTIWSAFLPPTLREGLERLGFRADAEADSRTDPSRGVLVTATQRDRPFEEWELGGKDLSRPECWSLRRIFSDQH